MKKSGWSNKTKSLRKVGKVMHEFKEGELHVGKSDKIVKNPKQAIAIALSEAGMSKKATGGGVSKVKLKTNDRITADDLLKYADLQGVPASHKKVGSYYIITLDSPLELRDSMNGKIKSLISNKMETGGGVDGIEYQIGDIFEGNPNANYEESWQLFKPLKSYVINNKTNKIVSIHKTPYEAIEKRNSLDSNFKVHYELKPKEYYKKMETGGGVKIMPQQGTLLTKDKKLKLDYKKNGNNFEFVVYEGETNPVANYTKTSFKKKENGIVTMDYNQFINYIYAEGYIDDKNYNLGGGVGKLKVGDKVIHAFGGKWFKGNRPNFKNGEIIKIETNSLGNVLYEIKLTDGSIVFGDKKEVEINPDEMANGGGIDYLDNEFWKDIAHLWRSEHIDIDENGKWFNTNKYKGVNNTTGLYFTNDSADVIVGLANSYNVKLSDVKNKNPQFTAFDYYKNEIESRRNKKYSKGGGIEISSSDKLSRLGIKTTNEFGNRYRDFLDRLEDSEDGEYVGYKLDLSKNELILIQKKGFKVISILDYSEFPRKGTWEINKESVIHYSEGGGIDMNDWDLPVIRSQFEEEEFEFGNGGGIYSRTMKTPDGNIMGKVQYNDFWKTYQVVIDGVVYEEFKTKEEAIENLKNAGFDKMALGGGIPNNYLGKGAEEVWNDWTETQRMHFLLDHQIFELHPSKVMISFKELPPKVSVELIQHISEGQYAEGGGVDMNDWDMPVIRTQFEDEEYEFEKGGEITDEERKQSLKNNLKLKF